MTTSEEIAERRAHFKSVDAISASDGTLPDEDELEFREQYIRGEITLEEFWALKNRRFSKMEMPVPIR